MNGEVADVIITDTHAVIRHYDSNGTRITNVQRIPLDTPAEGYGCPVTRQA